jgi:cysteine desulfurase
MNEEVIYLDNNSTTAIDDRVIDAMLPFFKTNYGNASSNHYFGFEIKKAIENSREIISSFINCDSKEIIFTSGATESINIALKGVALNPYNIKRHIITMQTEHKAVLDTCKYLETVGFDVDYLPVNKDGLLDLNNLKNAITDDTFLVCIMWVNNETGVIQPINEISAIIKTKNILFMTDATQAVGKLPIDLSFQDGIDLLCFSAHKFYGPKGIGALYMNNETISKKNISAFQHGGGHELGLRSGTLNVPAIIGFAKACQIANLEMERNCNYIKKLRDILEDKLLKIEGVFVNGSREVRLYNTSNICFPSLDADMFISKNKSIAVSNGSACSSALVEPSHVLTAMGLTVRESLGSLRISIGLNNKRSDIERLIEIIQLECKNGSNLV